MTRQCPDVVASEPNSCHGIRAPEKLTIEIDSEKKYHSRINPALMDSLLKTSLSVNPNGNVSCFEALTSAIRASSCRRCCLLRRL